jgi:hypothetical protein
MHLGVAYKAMSPRWLTQRNAGVRLSFFVCGLASGQRRSKSVTTRFKYV